MEEEDPGQDESKRRLSAKKIMLLFVLVLIVGLAAGVGMNFILSEPEADKAETGTERSVEPETSKPTASRPEQSSAGSRAGQQTFSVQNAMNHISGLSEHIGERKAGSVQESSAADYIVARLGEYGYAVEEQPFTMSDGFGSRNVLALRNGTREGYTVVIAAHYDSPADSPGAVDNATGVGVALELARLFSTGSSLQPSLQFAFFGGNKPGTAEMEQRLNGSRRFIDLLGSMQKKEIIGMIAVDSVGEGQVLALRTQGTGLQRLRDKLLTFANQKKIKVNSLKSTDDSDNIPFEDAKVPAVWVEWCDPEGNLNTDNSFISVDPGKVAAAGGLIKSFLDDLSPEDLEELKY